MLWQESEGVKNKCHLVNWLVVCMANSQWGWVLDLHTVNISLLSKWSWKLENKGGMWQEILMKKYVKCKPTSHIIRKPGDPHFWQGSMNANPIYQ